MNSKNLLILDLDETLIHTSEKELEIPYDFEFNGFFVYKRPFLNEFLESVKSDYSIAVWSSGTKSYVDKLLMGMGLKEEALEFVWSRSRCTRRFDPDLQEFFFLKDLKKVKSKGYSLDRVLILEDEPRKVQRHYGNAIYVRSYFGTADSELLVLKRYLHKIRNATSIRELEKRNWRSEMQD